MLRRRFPNGLAASSHRGLWYEPTDSLVSRHIGPSAVETAEMVAACGMDVSGPPNREPGFPMTPSVTLPRASQKET